MKSSKRSVTNGSASLQRASGETSAGYCVTNTGPRSVASTVFSNSSYCSLPAPASGCASMPCAAQTLPRAPRGRARGPSSAGFARSSAASTRDLVELRAEIEALALILDVVPPVSACAAPRIRFSVSVIRSRGTGVGLIELEHRELGVVPRRQAFVAEHAVQLVDALEAADEQAASGRAPARCAGRASRRARCDASRTAAPSRRPGSAASSASRPR